MNKIKNKTFISDLFFDGMTVMVGGFMANGAPEELISLLIQKDIRNITLISTDTGSIGKGTSRLIAKKMVTKLYASHIGTNAETGQQMNAGFLEVELIPQGTLAERIRCAGAGLGGVLTPTGIGTIVEEGKRKIEVNGQEYLLEIPLRADFALIKASRIDLWGNAIYHATTQNFNPLMAMAATTVIAQSDSIEPVGALSPESIHTPSLFVDFILENN